MGTEVRYVAIKYIRDVLESFHHGPSVVYRSSSGHFAFEVFVLVRPYFLKTEYINGIFMGLEK